ncbi:hypothetical protein BV898_10598 [Hypsibius exemplaris]|uniref:Uncharacterized protein n=1 Tax=Hypsibius exemplaris TaxID=2072580 RepID=A0A1W0WJ26_HYPEX|nr:hypothetical protein BV898_10598 [Hypsibius exemplaris]
MVERSHTSKPYIPTRSYAISDPMQNGYFHRDGDPENPEVDELDTSIHKSADVVQESHGWEKRALHTPIPQPTAHRRPPEKPVHQEYVAPLDPLDPSALATGPRPLGDSAVEDHIYNSLRTDSIENRSDDEQELDQRILRYLQELRVANPQIMRRFILACMENNVTEKDLIWMYHMRDIPQNGTLPEEVFVAITKQHLRENSQITHDREYSLLARSYFGFGAELVRYVDMCNDLHSWRVLCNDYKEFPLRQIYPPYRYPQKEHYPRPPQGDWHLDQPRRESHQLPTMTFDELKTIPNIVRRIGEALCQHHRFDALEAKFHALEKLKEDKTVECGLIPHDLVRQAMKEIIPLDIPEENDLESLCLYYEHPYILHFFRYRDFLWDCKFEMATFNPEFKETNKVTRKTVLMENLKRFIHHNGLNFIEPFRDFDSFGEGHLNRSHMKRAMQVLRIGPGQRCDISEHDIDFLLDHYCDNGETINYKSLNGDLMQVFPERFEPGGRLAMVMESFEPNLARGPYYPPRASLMSKGEIVDKSVTDEEVLRRCIDRLKMLIAERRIHLEPIFRIFDPFADKKGFRYQEFLQTIDTQSYPFRLPTYPVTLATMAAWKNKRAWYPEVVPQDVYQMYQGPEAIVEKCRRKVFIDRLNVIDFFRDFDLHNRGAVTRKQFRRATTNLGVRLSPIENIILENRYAYPRDIAFLDYAKFVMDMDLVNAPKDVMSNPAGIPAPYQFTTVWDRQPIKPAEVALAQEGFRKLCEKLLELRIHIEPYFHDFDPWRRGGVSQEQFRRIMSALSLDLLTEVEWKAMFKYFARPSQRYFDYRAFLDKVAGVEKKRERNIISDPRFGPIRT